MSYVLEFMLPGLPKMSNQLLRGHWRTKHGHAIKWKRKVTDACFKFKPAQPLERATLTLTRCSSAEPDFDGLVSGFKHVIDGIVECGIIQTDKSSCIGQPKYFWEKGVRGKGFLKVKVEQITKENI